ncbi:phosphoenolpyruvate--protein phosphotransferase [Pelovirga terrestris]|uniref:Phosphoenolpyruvate-protein phosphotransferase n=1 Tax=Pelovirga terrestris TaxID=2771352 RepID=A0A8J6QYX5_9BACT|nr:phosphoenolpyruvate--protein phosphotransferase [Pelovirga terrestris]
MVLEKNRSTEDIYLVGIGVSPGIAIGQVNLLDHRYPVYEFFIEADEIDAEIERFRHAVAQAATQLQRIKERVSGQVHLREHLYILDTHKLILEDEMLVGATETAIRTQRNAESALRQVLKNLRSLFDNIEDEYLRERRSDVDAVGERLLRILCGAAEQLTSRVEKESIIVAHDLSPAETMQVDRSRVLGFLTDKGGRTSHTAILARSLDIPAVVGLETITSQVEDRQTIIVDGESGIVILNPSTATINEYQDRKKHLAQLAQELEDYRNLEAVTTDGVRISLCGNLEMESEFKLAHKHGVEGIGLYRTEFLYLGRQQPPTEEEQFEAYCSALDKIGGQPITIRTLDIGGDKFVAGLNLDDEANPAMGLRAIRFSLQEENLFRVQLRAILRASGRGPVRIMFPMISGVAEIRACKRILREVITELEQEGLACNPDIPVGIMIETPSAVMIAPFLAQEVDFFSIGTNDLIQYFLAVDRGNQHVAYLYDPFHPAILRALKMTCDAAHAAGISVCICGEMAGEPLYTLVLIGLGLDGLSMNPSCVPRVKRVLRHVSKQQGEALVEKLLQLPTSKEVSATIDQQMRVLLPDLFARPLL